jgi:uncharacterized protein YuzE
MAEESKSVGNIDIDYDYPADVLYCSFGPPQEAVGEEMGEGVVVRRNPDTNAIVGITIVNFSRRFRQEPRNIVSVPMDAPVSTIA